MARQATYGHESRMTFEGAVAWRHGHLMIGASRLPFLRAAQPESRIVLASTFDVNSNIRWHSCNIKEKSGVSGTPK